MMDTCPEIRTAVPGDASGVGRVSYLSHSISYRDFDPAFAEKQDPGEHEEFWGEFLSDESRRARMWVAELGGRVVGFAMAGALSDDYRFAAHARRLLTGRRIAVLYAIHADPDCLGQGVGRALMPAALEYMGRKGFGAGFLDTHEANRRARRFYEAAGWEQAEIAADAEGAKMALYRVDLR